MAELPSGTVTFLFTDLEGSTRLWEQHAAAMRPRSSATTAILREAVEHHRGRVVKTTGDGLHGVFVTTRDALDAALGRAARARRRGVGRAGRAAGAHGHAHRRRRSARRRLLRPRHQPRGAGDGIGSRRPGRASRTRPNRSCATRCPKASRSSISASTDCPTSRAPSACSRSSAPGLRREFPPLRSLDALPGQPPRAARRRSSAARSSARRSPTRCWRRGSSPSPGSAASGRAGSRCRSRSTSLRRLPDGAWLCDVATAQDADAARRDRRHDARGAAAAGDHARGEASSTRCTRGSSSSSSTTASRSSTRSASWRRVSCASARGVRDPGDEQGGARASTASRSGRCRRSRSRIRRRRSTSSRRARR